MHLKAFIRLKTILDSLLCSWVSGFFTLLLDRVVLPLYANGERKLCNEKKSITKKKACSALSLYKIMMKV
jgi:hypothetical protein